MDIRRKRKLAALTRRSSAKKFGGPPSLLNETEPPTFRQIIQYSYYIQNRDPNLKNADIIKMIVEKVIGIWQRVNLNLPLHENKYLIKLVDQICFKKAREINRKSLSKTQEKNLEEKLDKLFDISSCSCDLPVRPCSDNAVKCKVENCETQHIICECPSNKKVPLEDREYLKDQRAKCGTKGCFQLGSVDKAAVKRNLKLKTRNIKKLQKKSESSLSLSQSFASESMSSDEFENFNEQLNVDEFKPAKQINEDYSFLKTPRFAMELIRSDVSSNLGANLANAFLLDLKAMGLLKPGLNVKQIYLDKSKIDREKNRMKDKSDQKFSNTAEKLICIGVDGRIDKDTLLYKEVIDENGNPKLKKSKEDEHHLTFTRETGKENGIYLTHRTIPIKGATGVLLGKECASVLEEFNSKETLKAVLIDNTNTNTGCETGLVTVLEKELKRKLHTIGCALHQNELPFRAVFKHLDSSCTKSPTSFNGPIGKLCHKNVEHLPQVNFFKFSGDLDDMEFSSEILKDLSTDQRLLLEYVIGISKGKVDSKYASWKIGSLNHARWLTLAIRLMCLWTRGAYSPELEYNLHSIIKFIAEVYAVSWFEIKRDGKFHNQPLNIFNMIQRIKRQSKEIKEIAFKNLNYNSFALLPENMLYSMIKSNDQVVQEIATKIILSIRENNQTIVRLKKMTPINFDARHWYELTNLSQKGICEPALTEEFSDHELQNALIHGTKLEIPDLPSHSQSVERAVKLTTEASQVTYGKESRHRHILAKIRCRQMRPPYASKGHYSENYDDLYE